jgi:Ca2+-binding EF-hand superfamily protein
VVPAHDRSTYLEHGQHVFEKLDRQKRGYITLQQFLDVCMNVSRLSVIPDRIDSDRL